MQKTSPVRIPNTKLRRRQSLDDLAEDWLASCNELSPKTIERYSRAVRYFLTFVRHLNGDQLPAVAEAFEPELMQDFITELRASYRSKHSGGAKIVGRRASESTVDSYYRPIRTWSYWLADRDYISEVDKLWRLVRLPKRQKPQIEPFSREQVDALLACCDGYSEHGVRNHAIILTLLDTGARAQELCSLTLADINFAALTIRVLHGKGDKPRMVRFGKATKEAILRYTNLYRPPDLDNDPSQPGPLFVSRNASTIGSLTVRGLEMMIHKLGQAAGLREVRCSPHTFRHTFALNFLRNGGQLAELQALLGHEQLGTVLIYVKLAGLDLSAAMRKASPVDNWKLR